MFLRTRRAARWSVDEGAASAHVEACPEARGMTRFRVVESGSATDEGKQQKRIGGIKVLMAGKGGALGSVRTAGGDGGGLPVSQPLEHAQCVSWYASCASRQWRPAALTCLFLH